MASRTQNRSRSSSNNRSRSSERSAFSWGDSGALVGAAIAGAAIAVAANLGRKAVMQGMSASAGDWDEVLAADAFAAFEEAGVFDRVTASRFVDAILSRGGSRDAMEAFVEFRGRKPDIQPLLRQFGMAA